MNGTRSIGLGAALSTGLRLAGAVPLLLFALTGARAAQAMVEASLAQALMAELGSPLGRLGAAGVLWLIAELASACVLALAVAAVSSRLRGSQALSPRWPLWALGYFFVGGAVMAAARLWVWTALGAAFAAWLRGLLLQEGGLTPTFALALALTLALPLGLFATLWIRAALARAAVHETGYAVALHDTVGSLRRRIGAPLAAVLVSGLAGAILTASASAILVPLSPRFGTPNAQELSWAVSIVAGALGALGLSFSQLWGLSALTALQSAEAGQLAPGLLPPPPVAPVVDAEPILAAAPVRPPGEQASSDQVIAALPVPKPDDPEGQ